MVSPLRDLEAGLTCWSMEEVLSPSLYYIFVHIYYIFVHIYYIFVDIYHIFVHITFSGAVTLQFQRSPFKALTRTSYIPWNQIHVIEPVVMASSGGVGISWEQQEDTSLKLSYSEPCLPHQFDTMKPLLFSSHQPSWQHGPPYPRTIFADSGVVQESVQVPGSEVHLVYHSSSASAALSTLYIRLTPNVVPGTLHRVHLKIVVAGVVFTKVFEGEADLVYTYGWNKRNVYNQKVYTDTDARVFVGYEYTDCPAIIWETQTTRLAGFQVDISDIGGWNINIHHHYNAFEGRESLHPTIANFLSLLY